MTSPSSSPVDHTISSAWEQEGHRISPALDFQASALVIGADPIATAEAALGIARAHARRRRVCVADVVGELKPIEDLLPPDVEYGLMDAFLQGVSLNKVARPVDPARNLLVMPSGARPIEYEAILSSPRWAQLATGFRDAGALLLVIAPPDAPGVGRAATTLGGVVLVGDVRAPAGAPVFAHVRVETMEPPADAPPPMSDAQFDEAFSTLHADDPPPNRAATTARPTPEMLETVQPAGAHPVPFWIAIGVAATVAIGFAIWAADHYVPRDTGAAPLAAASEPAAADSAGGQTALAGDSTAGAATDSGAAGGRPAEDVAAGTAIANPDDQSRAAAYSVAVAEAANQTGANVIIDAQARRGAPALTVAPERGQPASGPFLVVSGAFAQRTGADSLLRALRRRGALKPGQGHVEQLPLALLIQSGVSRDRAEFFVHGYRLKGLPVYALAQPDGTVNLYAGAFDAIDAAQPLLYTLRDNGDQPRVAYRIGSTF